MKKLFITVLLTTIAINAYALPSRHFGHVKYDGVKRQVGLLLKKVENEKDSYYAVVSEYLSPFREDNFIADFFRPGKKKLFSKKKNGYLQELYKWIRIYKMTKVKGTNSYIFEKLQVIDGKVIALKNSDDSTLNVNYNFRGYVKNMVMHTTIDNIPVILKFKTKRRFPLKSTWETKFTVGPYNPGYKQAGITILTLGKMNKQTNSATANFNVESLKGKKMTIKGDFKVSKAGSGMYTFMDKGSSTTYGAHLIEDKIGIFVDVYNAQPIMNTVELVLIDPANPYNSQMYFELYGNPDQK
ncbi:MAG: hypothetical protein N4A33_05720 [Bacteriovoracaceae bacterium]|jgi:hypothetical protein|nr:hypothetical protein [Bacteriovoracaceae bacterium]